MPTHSILQYAIDRLTKKVIFIKDVRANGNACNCDCPCCGEPLTAKSEATEKLPHFAHQSGRECSQAAESALHKLAKELIQTKSCIQTPVFNSGFFYRKSEMIHFHHVDVEATQSNLRPDLIGYAVQTLTNGKQVLLPLWIEILVTHKVDAQKAAKIRAQEIACIEIDLSAFANKQYTRKEIEHFLFETAKARYWINNPRMQKASETVRINLTQQSEQLAINTFLTNLDSFINSQASLSFSGKESLENIRNICNHFYYSQLLYNEIIKRMQITIETAISSPENTDKNIFSKASNLLLREAHPMLIETIWKKNILDYLLTSSNSLEQQKFKHTIVRVLFENGYVLSATNLSKIKNSIGEIFKKHNLNETDMQKATTLLSIFHYDQLANASCTKDFTQRMILQLRNYKTEQFIFAFDSLFYGHLLSGKVDSFKDLSQYIATNYPNEAYLFLQMANFTKKYKRETKNLSNNIDTPLIKIPLLETILHYIYPEVYTDRKLSTSSKHYTRIFRNM